MFQPYTVQLMRWLASMSWETDVDLSCWICTWQYHVKHQGVATLVYWRLRIIDDAKLFIGFLVNITGQSYRYCTVTYFIKTTCAPDIFQMASNHQIGTGEHVKEQMIAVVSRFKSKYHTVYKKTHIIYYGKLKKFIDAHVTVKSLNLQFF